MDNVGIDDGLKYIDGDIFEPTSMVVYVWSMDNFICNGSTMPLERCDKLTTI